MLLKDLPMMLNQKSLERLPRQDIESIPAIFFGQGEHHTNNLTRKWLRLTNNLLPTFDLDIDKLADIELP